MSDSGQNAGIEILQDRLERLRLLWGMLWKGTQDVAGFHRREHRQFRRAFQISGDPIQSRLSIPAKLFGCSLGSLIPKRHLIILPDQQGARRPRFTFNHSEPNLEIRSLVHVDAVDEAHLPCAARHHKRLSANSITEETDSS